MTTHYLVKRWSIIKTEHGTVLSSVLQCLFAEYIVSPSHWAKTKVLSYGYV